MLMGLGPFRFSVPTFSLDEISRRTSGRVAYNEPIGARPISHLLGPGVEEVTLRSVFHPRHMNKGGPALLAALHAVSELQTPLMLVSIVGFVYGRWIVTDVSSSHTLISAGGRAEIVNADLTLQKFNNGGALGRLGVF